MASLLGLANKAGPTHAREQGTSEKYYLAWVMAVRLL